MVPSTARPHPRLLLALVAVLAAAALVISGSRAAQSAPELPDVGADELLVSVLDAAAQASPVSGEAAVHLNLGLPDLSTHGRGDDPLENLTGDKRVRVWRSADGVRLARLDETAEKVFVSDGEEAWSWDSASMVATRIPVDREHRQRHDIARPDLLTAVQDVLAALEEDAAVTVTGTARIAGRDAYRLELVPAPEDTLIGRMELDVDATERIPIRVAVFARGAQAPAIEGAYTEVSFEPIPAETFSFTPPPGADVVDARDRHGRDGHPGGAARPEVRHIGDGWTKVTAVELPDAGADGGSGFLLDEHLPFTGTLFSARVENVNGRSWLLLGAVPQERLEAAADALR